MKWKRYQLIGMGAGALVFATVAGISFLLGTSTGLRVLSSGAEWAVDGLRVGDVSGSLLHLRLSDVRYEAPGIRFKADKFSYDVAGRAVFSNRIVVDDLRLTGAEVVVRTKDLPPSTDTPAEPSAPLTELRAPIPFFLNNLTVADVSVDADGTLVTLRDFHVSGRWFERGVTIADAALTGVRVSTPETEKTAKETPAPDASEAAAETVASADQAVPSASEATTAPADSSEAVTEPAATEAASVQKGDVAPSAEKTTVAASAVTDGSSPSNASETPAEAPKPAAEPTVEAPAQPLGERLTALFSKPLLPALPEVRLPVDIALENLTIADVEAMDNRLETLHAQASWQANVLTLSRFDVKGEASGAKAEGSLTGNVALTGAWTSDLTMNARAAFGTPEAPQSAVVKARLAGALLETMRLDTEIDAAIPAPIKLHVTGEASPAKAGLPLSLTVRSPGFSQDALTLSNVDVEFSGSAVDYALKGRTHLKVDQITEGDLTVEGKGTEVAASITALTLATDRGTAVFSGDVDWRDAIRWQTDLKIDGLDTGTLIFPKAPIRLSGDMQTKGIVKGSEWAASLTGVDLQGTIQKAPLGLKGSFGMTSDGSFLSPGLDLQLGINTVHLHGEVKVADGTQRFNIESTINAPDFSRAIPGATGRAEGHFHLKGRPTFPILDVDIRASNLSFADYALKSLRLKGGVAQGKEMMGDVTLTADHLTIPGVTLTEANARLRGKERKHDLTLSWAGTPVSGEMKLSGDFLRDAATWEGGVTSAAFQTPAGDVKLAKRLALRYQNASQSLRVGAHCWRHESAEVCLAKTADVDLSGKKAFPVRLALERFDLGYLRDKLPRRTLLEGVIKGTADLTVPAGFSGVPQGRVTLESVGLKGTIQMPEEDFVLGFDAFTLAGELREKRISLDWLLDIAGNGQLSGSATVTEPLGEKKLEGTLRMEDLSVAMVNPLLSAGEKAEGVIFGDLRFGGTLLAPTLTGETGIRDARVDSTKLPFEMLPSYVTLRFGGRDSVLEGQLKTPKGEVNIAGNASWETLEAWRAKVSVKSKTLRLTIPPMAELDLSTYVSFEALPEKYRLEGLVSVPWARITVQELPESAVAVSEDEVRLDRPGSWRKAADTNRKSVPLESALFIVVGDDVRVDAMGLKARLTGKLNVAQTQNSLGLNGQITVPFGQFRAYGQDLIVRKGEFLFSGPISNPLLTIEAVRNPERTADDVVAGVRVTGTVQRPKAVIFSEPALSEQEAFSYLIRGEGLDPSGDTDNSAITSALIGLGLSQGSGLLTEVGDAIGLTDFGIDTEGAGDSSQVVVSAYVLPGLKVKYGVGLFDSLATITLRYRLLPRLYFEAASGVDQALNVLYQFEF